MAVSDIMYVKPLIWIVETLLQVQLYLIHFPLWIFLFKYSKKLDIFS